MASSSTYTSMPRCHADDYHRPAAGLYMTGIPGYAAPESGYAALEAGYHTVPAPGLKSLSGLRGPESCGGRSRGSGRSSNRSLTKSEIQRFLRSELQQADLVGNITQKLGHGGALDSSPRDTYNHGSFATSSTGQPSGIWTDEHLGRLEEPAKADPCNGTEESFHTENGPAALQPRDELDASRAGQFGIDSPKGYGRCGDLRL